jgi:tetratricopeptide (TPR) repeat protein
MNLQEKLAQGITAAKAGNKPEARRLLTEVVKTDERQLEAWLWLSQVLDSLEDKTVCLENALTLDPDNEFAQKQLAQVKSSQEKLFAPTYAPGEEEPPPMVAPTPEPVQLSTADYPHQPDEFDDPLLCPYCVAPTQADDKSCPSCHQSFIVKRRLKKERSVWLWRGIFIQLVIALFLTAFGVGYFVLIAKLSGIPSPSPFLPVYFGQPVDQPPEAVDIMLQVFPLWLFWGLIGATIYSLLLILVLYFRTPNGHVIYLTNGGITLVLGLFGAIIFYHSTIAIAACIILFIIGAVQLLITMNLWYDFTFEQGRLSLKIDRDAKGHTALFLSGRKYSELGMWGLAVIHLRRAVTGEPNKLIYNIALIVAYMNIKRYDLAKEVLTRAEKLAPNSPEVQKLKTELAARA